MLDELDGWDDAEEMEGFGDVGDGTYQMKIAKADVGAAKSSGRLQINWDFEIVSGEAKGRHCFDHDGLETKQNRSFARTRLARLGIEWPDDREDLPDAVEEAVGKYCVARKVTKGDFENVYVQRELEEDDIDETPDDDDLEKGSRVLVTVDGGEYHGVIKSVDEDDETYVVKCDDGDTVKDISTDEIRAESEPEDDLTEDPADPDEPTELSKGDRVTVMLNEDSEPDEDAGETYAGKIIKVDNEEATVKFDDGEKLTLPLEALSPEEGEPAADPDDDDPADTPEVKLKFKGEDLKGDQKKKIKTLAKEHDFDTDDYDDLSALAADIAEFFGVSGSFKSAAKLLTAIDEATS